MLFRWSLAFFITAIAGALIAFGGIAQGTTSGAPALYLVFIAILVGSLAWGLTPPRRPRPHG